MSLAAIIGIYFRLLAHFVVNMLQKLGARALYFPSILRLLLREGPSHRWYDRIDETVILGALPFRKHTKEVRWRQAVI